MNITYTYKIVRVDEEARCMEILYIADGHQTMRVGARLPYVGETVEQVVCMYEPVRYWKEKSLLVIVPLVGVEGEIVVLQDDTTNTAYQSVVPGDQPMVRGAQTL